MTPQRAGAPVLFLFVLALLLGATDSMVSEASEQRGQLSRVNEDARLTASDAQDNDMLGQAVAISGDIVVVGAWREDGGPGDPRPGAGDLPP